MLTAPATPRHTLPKARILADNVAVAICSHHYRKYNTMVDLAAHIVIDTKKLLQVQASTDRTIGRTLREYVHHDANYLLETALSVRVGQNSRRS